MQAMIVNHRDSKLMNTRKIKALLGASAIVSLIFAAGQPANAGTLVGDWNYTIDSFQDGSGGQKYDIKGMAIKETADSIFVALTGGTPLAGHTDTRAVGDSIGWGDAFFNFSGKDFQTALADGDIIGVKFAEENDTDLATGVYQVDSLTSITTQNRGYSNLKKYFNKFGDKANMGDLQTHDEAYRYLYGDAVANNPTRQNTKLNNVIGSGTRLGDVELLNFAGLTSEGLDFAAVPGGMFDTHTFGFRFDRSYVDGLSDEYIAHLLLECANDGIALTGEFQPVPESASSLFGFAAVGLALAGTGLKRRKQQSNR